MRFTIFQESRKGSRRINQDRIAYTYGRDTVLLVVADGMGGHAGGEIAAQICVRLFVERFQQEAKPILRNPLKFLQDTMLRAHAALGSYANQFSMLETPRTTCVAVVVQAGYAHAVQRVFTLAQHHRVRAKHLEGTQVRAFAKVVQVLVAQQGADGVRVGQHGDHAVGPFHLQAVVEVVLAARDGAFEEPGLVAQGQRG